MSFWTARSTCLISVLISQLLVAWLTNKDFFYFTASFAGSLFVISFFLSRLSLWGLRVDRIIDDSAHEDERLNVRLLLHNRSLFGRAFLNVIDNFTPEEPGKRKRDIFVGKVKGKSVAEILYTGTCSKRGEYSIGPVELVSSDPMGIFRRRRIYRSFSRVVVYPKLFDIKDFPMDKVGTISWMGAGSTHVGGEMQEFYGIQEYRWKDDLKKIHWKSSARLGKLIVKQFEHYSTSQVTIVPDLFRKSNIGTGKESTLEYSIRIAASLARYLVAKKTFVQVLLHRKELNIIPTGRGEQHLYAIYDQLARADSDCRFPLVHMLSGINTFLLDDSILFLIILDADTEAIEALMPLMRRGIKPIIIVLDSASFRGVKSIPGIHEKMESLLERLDFSCLNVKRGDDLADTLGEGMAI